MALRWIGVCLAAAMACAVIRPQRPELATAVSLAAGAAAMLGLALYLEASLPRLQALKALAAGADDQTVNAILRCAGISVLSELAGQLCRDAGETALAGRVRLIGRVAILALCLPLAESLLGSLSRLVS